MCLILYNQKNNSVSVNLYVKNRILCLCGQHKYRNNFVPRMHELLMEEICTTDKKSRGSFLAYFGSKGDDNVFKHFHRMAEISFQSSKVNLKSTFVDVTSVNKNFWLFLMRQNILPVEGRC